MDNRYLFIFEDGGMLFSKAVNALDFLCVRQGIHEIADISDPDNIRKHNGRTWENVKEFRANNSRHLSDR